MFPKLTDFLYLMGRDAGKLVTQKKSCILSSKADVNKGESICSSCTRMDEETEIILESCEQDIHLQQKAVEKFQDLSKRLQNLLLTHRFPQANCNGPIKRFQEIAGMNVSMVMKQW